LTKHYPIFRRSRTAHMNSRLLELGIV
jgi:hypothetical protein